MTSAVMDYYKILEIERDASSSDIKKAYRNLALKYHPDKTKGDKKLEEKFKKITEAYETLKDPKKRSRYDQFGTSNPNVNNGFGGFGGFEGFGFGQEQAYKSWTDTFTVDMEDVMSSFRRKVRPARNSKAVINITFEENYFGVEKEIKFDQQTFCALCDGGKTQNGICGICSGRGFLVHKVSLKIKIPAGIPDGAKVRVPGKGEILKSQRPGDLFVQVHVSRHEHFTREHNNLCVKIPVPFNVLVFGGEISVPTMENSIKLKIPEGTSSGKIFKVPGKGFKSPMNNRTGDLLITVDVIIPKKLNKKAKKLLEEFSEAS